MSGSNRIMALCIVVLLLVLLLSACGKTRAETVFSDSTVTITRVSRSVIVQDAQTGEEYRFTPRLVKRSTAETRTAQSVVETDALKIKIAFDLIIVIEKDSGQFILIKIR